MEALTDNKLVELFVPGVPRPGGSKTATLIRRKGGEIVMKNGRPLITTRDDAKGNAEWKRTVASFARRAFAGTPHTGPVRASVTFVMPRPKYHFGTGRNAGVLKPDAPTLHTIKPDVLKLMRSTEDALTSIVWADDCLVVEQHLRKVYGARPGALVSIERAG